MTIVNYLYADLPKLASLQSQLTGRPVNPSVGVDLAGFEMELAAQGHLLDMSRDNPTRSLRDAALRKLLGNTLCLKVKGRAVLEDFPSLRRMLDAQPKAARYANQRLLAYLRSSDDFQQLEMTVTAMSDQLKEEVNRDARAELQERLRQVKADMETSLAGAAAAHEPDPEVLDGLKTWIDTFWTNTINLRIYPNAAAAGEQVLGPLKREHFTDGQGDTLHFAYGSLPTEPLTVLGIVTSVPVPGDDTFNPLAEFDTDLPTNAQALEMVNRHALSHVTALAEHSRTCRYPRVMVQPLLVYRSFMPNLSAR